MWKTYRYSRWGYDSKPTRTSRRLLLLVSLIIILVLGFQLGSSLPLNNMWLSSLQLIVRSDISMLNKFIGFDGSDKKSILGEVLPTASYLHNQVEDESSGFLITAIKDVTTVDFRDPRSFFLSQIALLSTSKAVSAEPEFIPEEDKSPVLPQDKGAKDNPDPPVKGEGPLVAVYCTHNAESYVPTQGVEKLEGKNGGVFLAASQLKKTLESKHGIGTVLSSAIHDYPDWSKSYANSLKTLKEVKAKYPSIKIFVDVHRDANTPKSSTTTEIGGKKAARIMFIVGSNTRLPHPNWRENYNFAKKLADEMEQMYPSLLREVRVQDGRYNQHVSHNAILVEIGATGNTMEEAERSAEMLADVINKVL